MRSAYRWLGWCVTPSSNTWEWTASPRTAARGGRNKNMPKKTSAAPLPEVHLEPYGNLPLDPPNPRIAELKLTIKDQDRILQWLWKNKAVSELVVSMLAGGYWRHEELFVSEEDGKLVVIE